MRFLKQSNSYRQDRTGVARGWKEGEREVALVGTECQFYKMKSWSWMAVTVAQQHKCDRCP